MKKNSRFTPLLLWLFLFFLGGCSKPTQPPIHILSGSENESLKPLLEEFTKKTGIPVQIDFKGSVDIMMELQQPETHYTAVWPAHSLWIDLSGNKSVKHATSIMRSPVVVGMKKSKAEALGITGKTFKIADLVQWTSTQKLSFMMSNPTQSNSGAMGYLGFLQGILQKEDVILSEDLDKPEVQEKAKSLLRAVAQTSGSSGWLKDLMVREYDRFDAMVNYESSLIEANQELEKLHREPLLVFYPQDGQAIADSPLAFISRGATAGDEERFLALQNFLLTPEVQTELGKYGRRTGLIGSFALDPSIFRSEWGIDVQKILQPIPMPSAETVRKALFLYQTALKKPSMTVYVLDFSGSMKEKGEDELKSAMKFLLSEKADAYFLQTGTKDLNIVIPFDADPRPPFSLLGSDPQKIAALSGAIEVQKAEGGTNIYKALAQGLLAIQKTTRFADYQISIILMTDGKSEGTPDLYLPLWSKLGGTIPIFSVMFGEADATQLDRISEATHARVFDGRKDLIKAFRTAKGYN